jgi:hypothetical protein
VTVDGRQERRRDLEEMRLQTSTESEGWVVVTRKPANREGARKE